MDILLINPPWYRKSGNIWKNVSSCSPPFGLALLAGLLKEKGYSVSILDCNALQIGLDRLEKELPEPAPKFVGTTAATILIDNALSLAKIVKEKYRDVKTIIGGVHATVCPEEVLNFPQVDFIVRGEGEGTLLDLISGRNPAEIKGLGYKQNGRPVLNPARETIPEIENFPFPAYDLLPMERYYPASGTYKRKPSIGMITSRGCPGRCTFCKGNVLGEKIRFRSARKIIEEIVLLQKNYGIRDIVFYDDTFTTNRKNVKEFCSLIRQKNLDLSWSCFSRVDTIDFEMLCQMREAGCHQVMYGVESASPEILERINKKISLQKVEETVAATKKAGIETRLAFMFGNPGETEETVRKTIEYALFLDPDLVSFNITTPFPGTEMFNWAEKNRFLLHKNWLDYDLSKPIMNLPTISPEKLIEYYKKAYFRFYLRPSYIFKRLMKIRNFEDFKRNFQPFISLLKFTLGG